MTTYDLLRNAWDWDPFVIAVCIVALGAYAVALRGRLATRPVLFAVAAAVVFILVVASPIGVLARGYLFSAHMLQHIILVLVVPPLVLLALPPAAARPNTHHPIGFLIPWLLGVGAMWFWHAPTLCDAAAHSVSVSRAQTVSLVAMGGAFWWPIVGPRSSDRLQPFGAIVYLFTACSACTVLGILVTFSPLEVCSVYLHPVDRLGVLPLVRDGWGLTPKADQEIGGLMMWVPGCVVYAASIIAMYARYSRDDAALDGESA